MPAAIETFRLSVARDLPKRGIVILSVKSSSVLGRIPLPSFPKTKLNFSGNEY